MDESRVLGARFEAEHELASCKWQEAWKVNGHHKVLEIKAQDGFFISYVHVKDVWRDGTNGTCSVEPGELEPYITTKVKIEVKSQAFRGMNWNVQVMEAPIGAEMIKEKDDENDGN